MIVVYFQWSKNPQMPEQSAKEEEANKEISLNEKKEISEFEPTKQESQIKSSPEDQIRDLGKNFIYFIANYHQFQMMDYYIKPKMPFEQSDASPLEK
jgi:hypothetical protein